jgi:hypothetical protein
MFALAVYFGANFTLYKSMPPLCIDWINDAGSLYGAFQSYARSVFAEMIPPGEEARFFGLFSITDKVYGPSTSKRSMLTNMPTCSQARFLDH